MCNDFSLWTISATQIFIGSSETAALRHFLIHACRFFPFVCGVYLSYKGLWCLLLDVDLTDLCLPEKKFPIFVSSQAPRVSRSVEVETKYVELMVINDHLMVSF